MTRATEMWYMVGRVERRTPSGVRWYDGYSLDPQGRMVPWLTWREAQECSSLLDKKAKRDM